MFSDDLLARVGRDRASRRGTTVDTPSPDVMRKAGSPEQGDVAEPAPGPTVSRAALGVQQRQAYVLQNRNRIGKLLRVFSSPRKRLGLTPDELLVFFAIGYLSTTISNGAIQITPIGLVDVSVLLGIPKETVRRKTARLAGLDYVSCTPKGVLVKDVKFWCETLERALA
ncbi:hypothetical protein JQ596_23815 [Bradyrhizobium manausense]|uniref:hypothetical protein n=1 Tax=Bradyrhizobium manausense TaxID=989370 RepID=UPI001BABDDDF|nr:hypothetical protein [Bradyrhizobium manausense]MBR0828567.1 hypothetical protein [Bradyrhizobium manausense]